MEKVPEVSVDEKSSNMSLSAVSFEDLNNCATQDACDFESDFESDSSFNDSTGNLPDEKPKLSLNITNYFKGFDVPAAVLSPISELALNVAKTNLLSATSSTINGKNL